jgi:trimeric autotransporter adhesin
MKRSHVRLALLLILLACLAISTQARATCQEGCLTNQNTVLGDDALLNGGSLSDNTAIGYHAIYSEQYGGGNTAVGKSALELLYVADGNTAIGTQAMSANTNSSYNTGVGNEALGGITRDADSMNTAVGYRAMALAAAFGCTAIGFQALLLTEGENNVAIGNESLNANSTGVDNTAVGWRSLFGNLTGFLNVGIGIQALFFNETGNENVALGSEALLNNTTGSDNIALGANAGINHMNGDNNIDIGNEGVARESGVIRIGTEGTQTASYIAGIRDTGLVTGTAVAVGITADGQLGVRASSVRFKELVKPMDKASEAILALQPVTFRYKNDPAALQQFGLVAEEVAKVNPDLVARDVEGKPFTVRYDEINAMLLNEFLKEHRKVQEQEAKVTRLESTMARQQKDFQATVAELRSAIKAQAAQLRQVSIQVEMSKPVLQTIANNQ